jgi:hypothetical protein
VPAQTLTSRPTPAVNQGQVSRCPAGTSGLADEHEQLEPGVEDRGALHAEVETHRYSSPSRSGEAGTSVALQPAMASSRLKHRDSIAARPMAITSSAHFSPGDYDNETYSARSIQRPRRSSASTHPGLILFQNYNPITTVSKRE